MFCIFVLMMVKSFKILILFVMLGAGLYSCRKVDEYPAVPSITFNSFEQYGYSTSKGIKDTALYINLEFTDGDGDIGYTDADHPFETDPYFHNLVLKMFNYENG